MTLAAGTKLGPYEIQSPLGAGGMGEVYRARDTRLERSVAIKVLPSHLSASPELRQRFEREARTISQLSHPHICALYDVGSQDGVEFLVMELLEGETLTDRLAKGPLALDQLLRFGVEIADALDKAHRQGIVHRDLKPGNVMLTKSGVKLLDFGLAKAMAAAAPQSGATSLPTVMGSARDNLTTAGTILGTFQYMAPEQLEGKDADARTDIFAFGCVLYEMATGRKAFSGASQASLISSIMSSEPPAISSISPMSPPALDRVVKTCLAKDPEDRFQTAHDVKLQLQWIAEGGSQAGLPAPVAARRRSRERFAWIVAAAALATALAAGYAALHRPTQKGPHVRSYLLPPEKTEFQSGDEACGSLSLSPDGRYATFATRAVAGTPALWVLALGEPSPRKLVDEGFFPFWSPDSRSVAFFSDGKLMRADAAGGPPLEICPSPNGRNGSWNREGVILFSPDPTSGLFRVPASGGKATPVTTLDVAHNETTHRWATFLPDGRHFLYMAGAHGEGAKSQANAIYVGSLDGKERTLLLSVRSNVAYASGRILYVRDGILVAQRFDPASRRVSGDPVPVVEGVAFDPGYFRGNFAVSDDGLLLYGSGVGNTKMQLRWYDFAGKPIGDPIGDPAEFTSVNVSFDGKRIAIGVADPSTGLPNIWTVDARGARSRWSSGPPADSPVWSPEGDRIAYARLEGRGTTVVVKPLTGGEEKTVLQLENQLSLPTDWSSDGRFLSVDVTNLGKKDHDIWIVPLSGDPKPYPFLKSDADELAGGFSPDGKWIAYLSNEGGRTELYVAPFPGPGGKWQISTDGAGGGGFTGKGLEMAYGDLKTGQAMSVELKASGAGLEVGPAKPMFPMMTFSAISVDRGRDRFLLATIPEGAGTPRVGIVTDWTAGLRK